MSRDGGERGDFGADFRWRFGGVVEVILVVVFRRQCRRLLRLFRRDFRRCWHGGWLPRRGRHDPLRQRRRGGVFALPSSRCFVLF